MANDRACHLCSRSDGELLGPFAKPKSPNRLYFHKDCIEVSNISCYSKQLSKWVNIGKAVETHCKKPSMCDRC